ATRSSRHVLSHAGPTTVHFSPPVVVDIAEEIDRKIGALRHHHSQVMKTRSEGTAICEIAQASAHFRGVQGRVRSAEGFAPLRLFINITGAPAAPVPARRRRGA